MNQDKKLGMELGDCCYFFKLSLDGLIWIDEMFFYEVEDIFYRCIFFFLLRLDN